MASWEQGLWLSLESSVHSKDNLDQLLLKGNALGEILNYHINVTGLGSGTLGSSHGSTIDEL